MHPTRVAVFAVAVLLFAGCHGKGPDVSGVAVPEFHIERFDTAFFSLDSNHIVEGVHRLEQEYPDFTDDFISDILGAGPLTDTSRFAYEATRQFLVSYRTIGDSLRLKYRDLGWLEKELHQSFQYLKYYFPKYSLPQHVMAFVGPMDGPGVALTTHALGIGLQSYAGKNFSFYLTGKGQDMYPEYISRRFEPQYIDLNCMEELAQDIFPDNSDGRPMVEQMVVKGRYWWLMGKLLPDAPDSITTGYTEAQLNWCRHNESQIWGFLLQNTDLYTVDPDIIKNYIGEGPKTLGMPDPAPGNIGAWVGWRIVGKYMSDHPDLSPLEVMQLSPRDIFEASKYKPK